MPEETSINSNEPLNLSQEEPDDQLFHVSKTLEQSRSVDLKPLFIPLGLPIEVFKPEYGGKAES